MIQTNHREHRPNPSSSCPVGARLVGHAYCFCKQAGHLIQEVNWYNWYSVLGCKPSAPPDSAEELRKKGNPIMERNKGIKGNWLLCKCSILKTWSASKHPHMELCCVEIWRGLSPKPTPGFAGPPDSAHEIHRNPIPHMGCYDQLACLRHKNAQVSRARQQRTKANWQHAAYLNTMVAVNGTVFCKSARLKDVLCTIVTA